MNTADRNRQASQRTAQHGLTLIELMISITLGMFVVAAALMLFVSSKSTYVIGDDNSRLIDTGRFAIENITRAARQTSYEDFDTADAPIVRNPASFKPNIDGYDASTFDANTFDATTSGSPAPRSMGRYASDILQLRFFGTADRKTVLDCAGEGIGAATSIATADTERGWSIYFVSQSGTGEPELRCGYFANGTFKSLPIATGVETFQVLYGIDDDANGIPERFLNATATASGVLWDKVAALKISMLIRGGRTDRADVQNIDYFLFGRGYTDQTDIGALVNEIDLPAAERARTRKIFSTFIQLRNTTAGGNITALP